MGPRGRLHEVDSHQCQCVGRQVRLGCAANLAGLQESSQTIQEAAREHMGTHGNTWEPTSSKSRVLKLVETNGHAGLEQTFTGPDMAETA